MKGNFARNLKEAMEQAHMSQVELSIRTGIGKSSISQYLSGANTPVREGKIGSIAEALGVSAEELLNPVYIPPVVSYLGDMKIGLKAAARCMRKSEAFVRAGLLGGKFPFGTAVQGSGNRVNPYISPVKFREYVGAERFDQFFGLGELGKAHPETTG